VPEYYAGADTDDRVRGVLTIRPEVRTFVADYLGRASK
jgi:hypothetical protein